MLRPTLSRVEMESHIIAKEICEPLSYIMPIANMKGFFPSRPKVGVQLLDFTYRE